MLGALSKEKASLAARPGAGRAMAEFLQGFSQPPKAEWDFNRWRRLGLLGGRQFGKSISSEWNKMGQKVCGKMGEYNFNGAPNKKPPILTPDLGPIDSVLPKKKKKFFLGEEDS